MNFANVSFDGHNYVSLNGNNTKNDVKLKNFAKRGFHQTWYVSGKAYKCVRYSPFLGIFLGICSCLCIAFASLFISRIKSISPMQITNVRMVMQLLLSVPFLIYCSNPLLPLKQKKLLVPLYIRCISGTIGVTCLTFALSYAPIGDSSAISYTSPVYVAILARIFLKEKITFSDAGLLGLAITGVLFVTRPPFIFDYISQKLEEYSVGHDPADIHADQFYYNDVEQHGHQPFNNAYTLSSNLAFLYNNHSLRDGFTNTKSIPMKKSSNLLNYPKNKKNDVNGAILLAKKREERQRARETIKLQYPKRVLGLCFAFISSILTAVAMVTIRKINKLPFSTVLVNFSVVGVLGTSVLCAAINHYSLPDCMSSEYIPIAVSHDNITHKGSIAYTLPKHYSQNLFGSRQSFAKTNDKTNDKTSANNGTLLNHLLLAGQGNITNLLPHNMTFGEFAKDETLKSIRLEGVSGPLHIHYVKRMNWERIHILGSAILGTMAQFFLFMALRVENAGVIAAVNSLTIVFTIVLQIMVQRKIPPWTSFIGSLIIIIAICLFGYRKWLREKERLREKLIHKLSIGQRSIVVPGSQAHLELLTTNQLRIENRRRRNFLKKSLSIDNTNVANAYRNAMYPTESLENVPVRQPSYQTVHKHVPNFNNTRQSLPARRKRYIDAVRGGRWPVLSSSSMISKTNSLCDFDEHNKRTDSQSPLPDKKVHHENGEGSKSSNVSRAATPQNMIPLTSVTQIPPPSTATLSGLNVYSSLRSIPPCLDTIEEQRKRPLKWIKGNSLEEETGDVFDEEEDDDLNYDIENAQLNTPTLQGGEHNERLADLERRLTPLPEHETLDLSALNSAKTGANEKITSKNNTGTQMNEEKTATTTFDTSTTTAKRKRRESLISNILSSIQNIFASTSGVASNQPSPLPLPLKSNTVTTMSEHPTKRAKHKFRSNQGANADLLQRSNTLTNAALGHAPFHIYHDTLPAKFRKFSVNDANMLDALDLETDYLEQLMKNGDFEGDDLNLDDSSDSKEDLWNENQLTVNTVIVPQL